MYPVTHQSRTTVTALRVHVSLTTQRYELKLTIGNEIYFSTLLKIKNLNFIVAIAKQAGMPTRLATPWCPWSHGLDPV